MSNSARAAGRPPEPAEFRAALAHCPTGVAVVTTYLPGTRRVGMVVGTFTSVSLDPTLVGWPATQVLQIGRRLGNGRVRTRTTRPAAQFTPSPGSSWSSPERATGLNGLLNDYGDDER
ncbi:flavin reductase family protein [Streptomyces sp. NPDC001970]